jgi:hypothetical protein
MSGEFIAEYDNSKFSIAINNMEQRRKNVGNTYNYIQEIRETYARYPEGQIELNHLHNVATFITMIGEGSFEQDAQAMCDGEILGLEFINELTADNGEPFKGGFALSFLKSQIDESLENLSKEDLFATNDEHWYKLARKIQLDLALPTDTRKFHSKLEDFAWQAAEELTDNQHLQYLTVAGFRLILTEALKPSTGIIAKKIPTYNQLIDGYGYTPTDQDLGEIVNEVGDLIWEDIPYVRTNFINKYVDLRRSFARFVVQDTQMVHGITRHIETELAKFNRTYELLSSQDLLSIRGDFFGVTNEQNGTTTTQLYSDVREVRGLFGGIHVVQAPSKEYLSQAILHPEEYEKAPKQPTILTPVIRIAEPVIIFHIADELPEIEKYGTGTTIDIPLAYENVSYQRIKTDILENQA